MSTKPNNLGEIKLEELESLEPLEALEPIKVPPQAPAVPRSSDFEELQEALSRTMREDQVKKTLDEPAPSPFHYQWHPVIGCAQNISEVCRTCIGRHQAWDEFQRSTQGYWEAKPHQPQLHPTQLMEPIMRRNPQDILVAPLSDLFQSEIDDNVRQRVFTVMKNASQHRFFILTKNPAYMRRFFRTRAGEISWPLPNVWLGVSVEDQESYNKRVYELLQTPAANYWVAFEPLLQPIDPTHVILDTFDKFFPFEGIVQAYEYMDEKGQRHWAGDAAEPLLRTGRIRWAYIGGQRGPQARPPHPAWVTSLLQHLKNESCNTWFAGFGDYGITTTPDLANDSSLMLVSRVGDYRGRGAGSMTNMLSMTFDGERSIAMTRNLSPKQKMVIDGKSHLQRAPMPIKVDGGIRRSPFLLTGPGAPAKK